MEQAQSPLPGNGEVDAPGSEASLDKIRDILVGNQMRDLDRRLGRLEERLVKECAQVRDDAQRRLETLEGFVKSELASLGERLKQEQRERSAADSAVERVLAERAEAIERRAAELSDALEARVRELREALLEQSRNLRDEGRKESNELSQALRAELALLDRSKVDRRALSLLLGNMAMSVGDDGQGH